MASRLVRRSKEAKVAHKAKKPYVVVDNGGGVDALGQTGARTIGRQQDCKRCLCQRCCWTTSDARRWTTRARACARSLVCSASFRLCRRHCRRRRRHRRRRRRSSHGGDGLGDERCRQFARARAHARQR